MDILENVLSVCRFRAALYCRCENSAPWGIAIPGSTAAQFHSVRTGRCWIRVEGAGAVCLETGDFAVVPHGHAHDVLDHPRTKPTALTELLARAGPSESRVLGISGGGQLTELVCGGCDFGNRAHKSLFDFLPRLLHLRAKDNGALKPVLDLADRELSQVRPASPIILARLGDILFIEAIRTYSLGLRPGEGSWLTAVADPHIAQVLRAIHAAPANGWTLTALAAKAGMSRSSLVSRFRELVGVPIRVHLTRVRMIHATALFEDADLSTAEIAHRVGYQSVTSFHRAFLREVGIPPGEFRTKSKQASSTKA